MTIDRLEFLAITVAKDATVRELLEYYRDNIIATRHSANTINGYGVLHDPNGLSSIRDMAVLEFINTILNAKEGAKDGRPTATDPTGSDATIGAE